MIDLIENEVKNFKNLKNFKDFLKEQDETKNNELIEFKDWKMKVEGLHVKGKTYPMRDSGMKTLLTLFGMPINFYYKKSPTDMLVRDINRMRDEFTSDSELIVYYQDNEVRAISKPNVKNVPCARFLERTELSKKLFDGGSYSDFGMRIISSDEKKAIKVSKGDVINSGVELMYSDIGYYRTTGVPYLNRLVCTNGMIMKDKHPLLTTFSMSYGPKLTEDQFLESITTNLKLVEANTEQLGKTFRIMKREPIKALTSGEPQMKKIRQAIGPEKFDDREKLTVKIMDGDAERHLINTELPLYSAIDIITRMAKGYDYLNRRRIEGLAGGLTLMAADELL
jgi:hypothetical protein